MCRRPFIIRKDKMDAAIVPCGKCDVCLKRRAAAWAFRLHIQDRHSISSFFVTLTYDDAFLPICDAGYGVSKHDLQCFFKRLRKLSSHKISYYACGEYGGRTCRPHYHAIIFNSNYDDVRKAWSIQASKSSPAVSLGHVHFLPFNDATIRYCTGYVCKSYGQKLSNKLPPQFSVMSKRLGSQYLTDAVVRYHRAGDNNFLSYQGVKIAMPRYFGERLFTAEQRKAFADTRVKQIADGELKIISDVGIFEFLRDKRSANIAAEVAAKRTFDDRDIF